MLVCAALCIAGIVVGAFTIPGAPCARQHPIGRPESSYKYSAAALETLVASAAFTTTRLWTDASDRFWVGNLCARTQPSLA